MDINLVSHAKDYIDDLAKGINPFTKEEVNESDIINNIKISRCLFYVSEILNEVISNGGVNRSSKPKDNEGFLWQYAMYTRTRCSFAHYFIFDFGNLRKKYYFNHCNADSRYRSYRNTFES